MKTLRKLNERLYVYDYDTYTDRLNIYYILGDNYSVAVEAGASKRHCDEFYEALNMEGLRLPEYTIISHWHWDHSFGLNAINGKSISTKKTQEYIESVKSWIWTKEEIHRRVEDREDIEFCALHIPREYPVLSDIKVVNTDEGIEEKKVLDLGGVTLELIPAISTHSDDCLYVYSPELRILIVEDADGCDFFNGGIYHQDLLAGMIEFFESLDYDYHYLGHANYQTKEQALNRLKSLLK